MCGASGSRRSRGSPQGLVSARALEQLTISGLARRGQTDLENHLGVRALLSGEDVQNSCAELHGHDLLPAVTAVDGHWRGDMEKVSGMRSRTHQRSICWYKDEVCKKCAEAWTLGSCVLENRRKDPKGPWLDGKGPKATTTETPSIQRRVLDVVLAKKKRDSTRGERRDQLQKLLWKKCGVWLSMTVTVTAPDIQPVLMK